MFQTDANRPSLLLAISSREAKYVQAIGKSFSRFSKVKAESKRYSTFTELKWDCQKHKTTHVATTDLRVMKFFDCFLEGTKEENIGYMKERDGITCLLIPELSRVWSQNSGRFLIDHYLQKFTDPEVFITAAPLTYSALDENTFEEAKNFLRACSIISVDIETEKEGLLITSCSYTGILPNGRTHSYVLDFRNIDIPSVMFRFTILRTINDLPVPKLMQRGIYDSLYFVRFAAPLRNYIFDTYNFQHCLFPELKKELEFIALMYVSNVRFWKDEKTSNHLEYNAKDTHYTLFAFLGMMRYAKKRAPYAFKNFLIEFKMNFPNLLCSVEGFRVDQEENKRLREIEWHKKESSAKSLGTLTGYPTINANSPKQMKELINGVDVFRTATSKPKYLKTDVKAMQAFSEQHPLHDRLAGVIKEYRGASKAISQYYDFEQLNGRMMYELDAGGTETGRMASKKSGFWCGAQIQNQPLYCKSQYIPDEGYVLGSCDNSQSESRCTGYIAQDPALIRSVEESPDFHCANASLFFGIPFDELYDAERGIVLNKPIRTLSKRVNHGANYNMGWSVLAETMGTANVYRAARLLGLPMHWTVRNICEYLLGCFDKAYPKVRGEYQQDVIREIELTGKLVGETGWTRRTFLQPNKNKPDLNAAVAHKPQSLSVMLINQAFYEVFLWQLETNSAEFRLKAQVHDEILLQYRPEATHVMPRLSEIMESKTATVHGKVLKIPNDYQGDGKTWADLKD